MNLEQARQLQSLRAYGVNGKSDFNNVRELSAYWFVEVVRSDVRELYLYRSQWPTIVRALQEKLGAQVDGKFGPITLARLRDKQRWSGVAANRLPDNVVTLEDLEWIVLLAYHVPRLDQITPAELTSLRQKIGLPSPNAVVMPRSTGARGHEIFGPVSSQNYAQRGISLLFSRNEQPTPEGAAALGVAAPTTPTVPTPAAPTTPPMTTPTPAPAPTTTTTPVRTEAIQTAPSVTISTVASAGLSSGVKASLAVGVTLLVAGGGYALYEHFKSQRRGGVRATRVH